MREVERGNSAEIIKNIKLIEPDSRLTNNLEIDAAIYNNASDLIEREKPPSSNWRRC